MFFWNWMNSEMNSETDIYWYRLFLFSFDLVAISSSFLIYLLEFLLINKLNLIFLLNSDLLFNLFVFRYIMIAHHSWYSRVYRKHNIALMIVFSWMFSYGMQIPTLLGIWGKTCRANNLLFYSIRYYRIKLKVSLNLIISFWSLLRWLAQTKNTKNDHNIRNKIQYISWITLKTTNSVPFNPRVGSAYTVQTYSFI